MSLLAIDLGLRTGFAHFDDSGTLVAYRSTRFPSRAALKKAVWAVLGEFGPPTAVVAEGDKTLGSIWRKVAEKRCEAFLLVDAETWREQTLLLRDQRSGAVAKAAAIEHALELIADSDAPAPVVDLTDDIAEAILLGQWYLENRATDGDAGGA